MANPFKLVVVGNPTVGKTSILVSYTTGVFPKSYIPTVFESFSKSIIVNEREYRTNLWDTAGQEEYEELRTLMYENVSVYIVCFSVNDRNSFDAIQQKWMSEIHPRNEVKAPIILVGTKADLRDSSSTNVISQREAQKLKREIKAVCYLECSALTREGLENVFETATKVAAKIFVKQHDRKCTML